MSDHQLCCGRGREIDGQYGPRLRLSFSQDDLEKMSEHLDENGYVNVWVKPCRKPTDKTTHYCEISTWQPNAPASASRR